MQFVKKEVAIAIILGLTLGTIGTLSLTGDLKNNLGVLKNKVLNLNSQKKTTELLSPTVTTAVKKDFLIIDQANELIATSGAIIISGKALPNSGILISSEKEDLSFTAKNDGTFSKTVNLTFGDNKILIELTKKNTNISKDLLIYYFPFIASQQIAAQSPTPTLGDNSQLEKIRQLKERVANKVLELRKNSQQVYYGEIGKIDEEKFTMETNVGEKSFTTDESTVMSWLNTNDRILKISYANLEIGDYLVITGEESGTDILAKQILGKIPVFYFSGSIKELVPSTNNFSLSIKDDARQIMIITNEKTKISQFSGNTLAIGNFQDIKMGMKVLVRGSYQDKEKQVITAKNVMMENN